MFANIFSTLVDFEPYPSLILFTCGCNLRCKYCYNHDLISVTNQSLISEQDADKLIDRYRQFIDGIVISGGEPTLHQNKLIPFLTKQKQKGLKIKIDSNLTLPLTQQVLELIDGVSFTIKPYSYYTQQRYINTLKSNLRTINASNIHWKEARITVVRELDLTTSVLSLIDDITTWKITVHNAILPETGILSMDDSDIIMSHSEYEDFTHKHILPAVNQRLDNVEVRYA